MKSTIPTALKLGTQLAAQGVTSDPELINSLNALRDPGYHLTRQATALAEKILSREEGDSLVRVFVSLGSEEHQGLAAIQLGLALAVLSRQETLLVNASSDHAQLDTAFGPTTGGGLAGLLQGKDGAEGVATTKVPGLAFLPLGDAHSLDSATLTTKILGRILGEFRVSYPQIIVLCPSLEAEESSALLLCADEVVGIAAGGRTTRSEVEDLEKACASLDKPLLGVLLSET